MPYSIFPPLPFQLPEITFPFHKLKVESLPIHLNHEYYSDLFENDFLSMIPECFGLLAVFIVLLYGVIFSSGASSKKGDKGQNFGGILGLNTSWIAILSIVLTLFLLSHNPISNASVLYCCFLLDDLALFLKMLVLVGSLFSILISLQYLQQEKLNNFELQTLILISSVSMLFLISSVDFISIYLAIECQSLCFYVMAGLKRESEFSTEAGLKYFLLGAFSSGILLFGLGLQYGFTGTTNFSELSKIFLSIHEVWKVDHVDSSVFSEIVPSSLISLSPELPASSLTASSTRRGCELGMIFVLVGFLFKLSAVPYHMWAPDVYEGAPTSVTAFFAIVPKVSILAICLRFCSIACYGFILSWQKILILSSILSMILGALAALAQNKIKRLLAWSSIGHVGFLLAAIVCGTVEGNQAVVFYIVIYTIMTISLFQVVLCPLRREKINSFGSSSNSLATASLMHSSNKEFQPTRIDNLSTRDESDNQQLKYTTDLAFLSQSSPILAMTIMITMFSIAGIPPLAGFFSKAFLLFATISAEQFALAIVVIISSVVSCFYYIRIVKIMYFEPPLSKWRRASKERSQTSVLTFLRISKESSLVFGTTFALLAFFCCNATLLLKSTHFIALSFS